MGNFGIIAIRISILQNVGLIPNWKYISFTLHRQLHLFYIDSFDTYCVWIDLNDRLESKRDSENERKYCPVYPLIASL